MCSTREEITEAFASLATALSRVLGLTFDALTTPERLALLEHCETARRQLPSVEHTLINQIGEQSTEEELGGKLGLTLGCGGHHPLAERGWTTRKNAHGDTEWLPPPHLDHGQPRVNTFHHPEKLLADDEGDP